jgi:hypothetical protein
LKGASGGHLRERARRDTLGQEVLFMESNGKQQGDAMRAHTSQAIQERIDSSLEDRIRFYAMQPKEAIERRLQELDRECDVDRTMMMNGAGVALGGVVMSFLGGGRKWLLLSGAVLGYMLMHGVERWSPPATALRRLGLRTRAEIDAERYALKLLRGDFESIHSEENKTKSYPAEQVWSAVRS